MNNIRHNLSRLHMLAMCILFVLLSSTQCWSADQAKGEQLYTANCAKCHGRQGEGFLRLYPPIHDSRFLKENVSKFPCIIRNGLKGKITIETTTFNQIMPAIQQLSPEQISDIITFLQNEWNHPVTKLRVEQWLKECNRL